jgi:hypothetical protein
MSVRKNSIYSNAVFLIVLIIIGTGISYVALKVMSLRPVTLIVPRGAVVTVDDYTLNPKKQPLGTDLQIQTYLIRLPIGTNQVDVVTEDREVRSYKIEVKKEEGDSSFRLIDNDFRDHSRRQEVDTGQ